MTQLMQGIPDQVIELGTRDVGCLVDCGEQDLGTDVIMITLKDDARSSTRPHELKTVKAIARIVEHTLDR